VSSAYAFGPVDVVGSAIRSIIPDKTGPLLRRTTLADERRRDDERRRINQPAHPSRAEMERGEGVMDWLTDPRIWASLLMLTGLEIVLGIDNLVLIAILAGQLPEERQHLARQVGLALALITRLALLASITWITSLTQPLFDFFGHLVSWRDIVLAGGGVFLLYKGTHEIHQLLEGDRLDTEPARARSSFAGVVGQIVLFDILFSLDSVITAVGTASELWVMATAIIVAVTIMLAASKPLAKFVERHPTVKMLALSFLLLIGMTLIADGAGFHVPRGYIYAAIGFSIGVETLNQIARRRRGRAVDRRSGRGVGLQADPD
jgi:predicted tellurium resistance membrane protein TerC